MIKKEIVLKGYFKCYDEVTKKLTIAFLDESIEPFTKSFLSRHYSYMQNNPMSTQQFYVKFNLQYSMCYLDKLKQIRVPLQKLLEQIVTITVYVKHYNFVSNGKKIQGWNLNLLQIIPV